MSPIKSQRLPPHPRRRSPSEVHFRKQKVNFLALTILVYRGGEAQSVQFWRMIVSELDLNVLARAKLDELEGLKSISALILY